MSYSNYVNVKQGTDSSPRFSKGNTLPFIQMPFGMNGFTFQTDSSRGNWFYHPQDHSLEGIRLTHQPSPWIGDYGHLVFMPQRSAPFLTAEERWSGYQPGQAVLRPGYMKVYFDRYRSALELVPTERGAAVRLHFEGKEECSFAVLPVEGKFHFAVDEEENLITGYTNAHTVKTAENFAMYFAFWFSCPIDRKRTVIMQPDGTREHSLAGSGEKIGICAGLTEKEVEVRLAVSFISEEQAVLNLKRELLDSPFEVLKQSASEIWEEYLSKIEIETTDEEQKKTFYSCLYRVFLFPRKFYEEGIGGEIIHYCADTGEVRAGVKYVENGFWDTYRTVYPLFSILLEDQFKEMLEGYVNTYLECGWLPKWPSPSEAGMMPGTLIDAVIADGAVKGILKGDLLEKAYEGMIKHATVESPDRRYGRYGIEDYKEYGYLPNNKYSESVNHTLDYAYGDFCISQIAGLLGKEEEKEKYLALSKNYRNLFDPKTGFMRGKDDEGHHSEKFSQFSWGGDYCEGGPWQNSFAVYHDIEGLAKLYGGKKEFIEKLDLLFETPPIYETGGYQREIHEMTEMAAAQFGQCAISNQPSFHIPYLYAALGEYEKTEYWVEKMAREGFSSGDGGYPGDEDNGSMAGWYLFSTLGIYPLCPGKPEFLKIKPLVERAVIHLPQHDYVIEQGQGNYGEVSYNEIVKA